MEFICTWVANGHSLLELCRTWKISFGEVIAWIQLDQERKAQYTSALSSRKEWIEERILEELRRIGLCDIKKLYDKNGKLIPIQNWPDEVSSIVKGVDYHDDGEIKKITFWNKEKCLELLGKNIALFTERVEHTGNVTLENLIADSRKPPEEDDQSTKP